MAAQCCKKNMDTEMSPMSELTDDLLVEIFSRVPFKSTCCCKCVSTRWRGLVSHPDHRRKMPQTLAGFFFRRHDRDRCPSVQRAYQSVSGNWYAGIDTSLSFLPRSKTMRTFLLDCCNGLLLCRQRMHTDMKTTVYVVCNPATNRWVDVPSTSWSSELWFARLAFDPAVSSHFHVFEFTPVHVVDANMQVNDNHTKGVSIYSSEAGAWTHRIVWDNPVSIPCVSEGVFFSRMLYLWSSLSRDFVVAVGMEGNCRAIRVPAPHFAGYVHHVYLSQRRLHLIKKGPFGLEIWVLNSSGENWTLKQRVSRLQLLGKEYARCTAYYVVISVDQEKNVIYTVCGESFQSPTKLISYKMDSKKLSFICDIGRSCLAPYLSYVPLFSESVVDGH